MVASGVTATAGFGVLAFSDIRMLRDFGLVTLIDLSVSLLGVLIALPAVIVIAEREHPAQLLGSLHRSLTAALLGLRSATVRRRPRPRARPNVTPAAPPPRRHGSGHGPA